MDATTKVEPLLAVQGLWKSFGQTAVLSDMNFSVSSGEIFFVLGPSGCGKTTLLRVLAGFCAPDRGKVFMEGTDITGRPPNRRDLAMVFQNYALWPHMTVRENVAYGLRVRRLPGSLIRERVSEILEMTGLASQQGQFPGQLSGGQQQRVALARAIVVRPRILLLDEPLSNLDAKLREQMRDEIRRIQIRTGITMVYVTHDQREALTLGSRIAVLNAGTMEQVGTPTQLYIEPESRFVAGFLGRMNIIEGRVVSEAAGHTDVETPEGTLRSVQTGFARGQAVHIGFRPEAAVLNGGPPNTLEARVLQREYGGQLVTLIVETPGRRTLAITLLTHAGDRVKVGDSVRFGVPVESVRLFTK